MHEEEKTKEALPAPCPHEASEAEEAAKMTKGDEHRENDFEGNPADHAASALSQGDLDQDPGETAEAAEASLSANGLSLEAELARLRAELKARDALLARFHQESSQLALLYPEVSPASLPDAVWEDIKLGVPMAAAYALFLRKEEQKAASAAAYHRQNSRRSPGGMTPSREEFYSPAEVRAMSREEVKRHYHSIMKSMEAWK